MRKLIVSVAAIASLLLAGTTLATSNNKVTICHVPPGNPDNAHTITISKNALKAHFGDNEEGLHGGDYYGECDDEDEEPTPTPTPTETPAPTETPTPTDTPTPTETPVENPTPEVPQEQPRITLPPTDTES